MYTDTKTNAPNGHSMHTCTHKSWINKWKGGLVCVWLCGQVVKALGWQSKDHRFKSYSYHWIKYRKKKKKTFFTWHPTQATSKIVNWGPGLGWGRTRPLAVPNSTEVCVISLCSIRTCWFIYHACMYYYYIYNENHTLKCMHITHAQTPSAP